MKMNRIAKIISLAMVLVLAVFCFAGCGSDASDDVKYVKDKGTLIIGITEFAPMDYKENPADSEWIGFDADMAKAFAESLGVKAEFIIIDWDNKSIELDNKSIDCVWNGMTISDKVKKSMDVSNAYCKNAQVVVVPSSKAADYQTVDSIKNLNFAAEAESAGLEQLKELGCKYTEVGTQTDALMEVSAGTSDACVIDLLMAGATIGNGTDYENLTYTVSLNSEEYGVGFRKGSNLVEKLNEFFKTAYADGTMTEIANKYGVQESIIEQK